MIQQNVVEGHVCVCGSRVTRAVVVYTNTLNFPKSLFLCRLMTLKRCCSFIFSIPNKVSCRTCSYPFSSRVLLLRQQNSRTDENPIHRIPCVSNNIFASQNFAPFLTTCTGLFPKPSGLFFSEREVLNKPKQQHCITTSTTHTVLATERALPQNFVGLLLKTTSLLQISKQHRFLTRHIIPHLSPSHLHRDHFPFLTTSLLTTPSDPPQLASNLTKNVSYTNSSRNTSRSKSSATRKSGANFRLLNRYV